MQVTIDDIGGVVMKEDDRYTVKDNNHLNNLVLSSTFLFANKSSSLKCSACAKDNLLPLVPTIILLTNDISLLKSYFM